MEEQNSLPIEIDSPQAGSIEEVNPPEFIDPPDIYYYRPEDFRPIKDVEIQTRERRGTRLPL
jgi:hypothetical protein